MILDVAECDGARLARDPSYDGRFFTGVCTTGRLLRPNSLNFGLVFVVGLKPPRSPQPGRAPVRRLIGRCILSGIRREARGLEGDQECYRNRCAPLRGSHLTLRWREMDSNIQSRVRERFSRLAHLSSPDNARETPASNFDASTARYS